MLWPQVRAFVSKLHLADCALDHFACTDSVGAVSTWLEAEATDAASTRGEPSKAREIARDRARSREIAPHPCGSACASRSSHIALRWRMVIHILPYPGACGPDRASPRRVDQLVDARVSAQTIRARHIARRFYSIIVAIYEYATVTCTRGGGGHSRGVYTDGTAGTRRRSWAWCMRTTCLLVLPYRL